MKRRTEARLDKNKNVCYNGGMRKNFLRSILMVAISAVVMVASVLSATSAAQAIGEAQKFMFGQNNILFYDPDGGGNLCKGGKNFNLAGVEPTGEFNDNALYIMAYLLSEGYSAEATAAIVGNLKGESGSFNPGQGEVGYSENITDPNFRLTPSWNCWGKCGFGIGQWTYYTRQQGLQDFADEHGMSVLSLELQIMYVVHELTGYGYTPENLNALSLEEASYEIFHGFFRPRSSFQEGYYGGKYYNDYDPKTLSMLDPTRTKAAYEAFMTRLGYTKGALQVIADNDLATVASTSTTNSALAAAGEVDGTKVTLIGDSISNDSTTRRLLAEAMPGIDIRAQDSKQFYTGTESNPGGIEILREMAANNTLREIVVYELGTNGQGSVTQSRVQEVLDVVGANRKVIFVTNYGIGYDFESNNLAMMWARDSYPNQVSIADWASIISTKPDSWLDSGSYGVHPATNEARQLYVDLVKQTISGVGTAGVMASECGGAVNGGINDSQAQALANYYNSDDVDASYWGLPFGKKNCVSFSYFFVQRFTSVGRSSLHTGDGRQVSYNLSQALGMPTGDSPRPYSVFSVTQGVTDCTLSDGRVVKCGHTGVVVAVNGNDITTVEAAYPNTLAYVAHHDISYFTNAEYGNSYVFMYLDTILDQAELAQIINKY